MPLVRVGEGRPVVGVLCEEGKEGECKGRDWRGEEWKEGEGRTVDGEGLAKLDQGRA